ncbi:MAG: hypothetical protein IKW74_05625, partial [Thermoguttaceae bacterium]|nr:hypothetical protein [Thermoguttaceae bacterium]
MKKYIRWGICVLLFGGMLLFWGTVQGDEETFRNRLITDWMYQDYGLDLSGCFTSSDSCQLETAMIEKVLAEIAVWNEENGNELDGIIDDFREQLESFKVNGLPGSDPVWRDLYLKCCEQRRRLRLESVLEHCPDIVYTKHYVIGASHYAYTEDVTDETFNDYSCNRSPGGQLCQMTLREDGTIENKVLYETKEGTIRDPDISWDGKRILFSMRKIFVDDDFHLYEYNTENGEVRQLTFSTGFADIEPVYLPNGDLLFGSTRCVQLTDCWWTEVANFYTCDKDGRFLRRVTKDQVTTNYPKLLDDGRIIYTRWDYNDRGQIFPQPLFVMNADGTGQTEYYGNNSFFPTTVMHARGIPGTNKLLAIASGHHTYQQGKLILIDRSKGTQENSGCTLIAPVRETPDDHIDAYGQDGELFQYPYPIDENNFLVTYLPEGSMGRSYKIPFGIYWMNLNGDRELLVWDPSISSNQEIPLASRPVPPVRPSQVDLEKKTAEYYVQNVYEGPGLQGVEPGTVKSLRVVALDFRTAGIHSNFNSGEAGGGMVSTPVSTINGTWDVKKVLGHVPVEEDGSAYFEVPAMTPVYFQLLDSNDDVVQTMRSWSTLQPGESFACVGCHEPKENVVGNINPSVASIALTKGYVKPVPPYEPPRGAYQNTGFSFIRDIQPILDMRCVSYHTSGENVDGTQAPFSLKGDTLPVTKDDQLRDPGRAFSESYMNLTECGHR